MLRTLSYFQNTKLNTALEKLFKDLDVPVALTGDAPASISELLESNHKTDFDAFTGDAFLLGTVSDDAFEGITTNAPRLENIRGRKYDFILVFGIEIKRQNVIARNEATEGVQLMPTRTQLFDLARAFNREFPDQPVVLVFRYCDHFISVAVCERLAYKRSDMQGDKIGKMSLLRDIDVREHKTHSGHLRILQDMTIQRSGKEAVNTYEELYAYWQKKLNVSVLNKRFYEELSNWYFWALHQVAFSNEPNYDGIEPLEQFDERLKMHRANNVIRLITRLIFTWFLKEKKLVSDKLFDIDDLTDVVNFQSLTPGEDEDSSTYYTAILQNLFFATLNQEMDKRRFKSDKTFQGRNEDYDNKNVYRHKKHFKSEQAALDLFKNIPFLNGGLFECLDQPLKQLTIDGFSDKPAEQPHVPNFLFFQKKPISNDLNDDYGTKNKKYEVRGLINILNDYKFTVAENTPLEEEIALDPELLGRIFENLLASYNPETKTSARKQTGSFYTPREIVNYMVDESLMAYLKNEILQSHAGALKLGEQQVALFGEQTNKKGQFSLETQPNASRWNGRENELEQNLRILFDTSETQPFTDTQDVQDLIRAIDTCKILDPACGSGAFPMGILHRMVNLLHKLDPKNHLWEERQLFNAESIEDPNARDEAIKAIKKAFEKNELDYGRKLYLIENCIYGVDIQPIAVQIAKLRFFISLICDQKMEDTEGVENRGVLALPNLETKFVAANTLIGLDNSNLAKMAVEDLMKQREQLRHRIFSAKRYADKKRYREQDERIRQQIKDKLDTLGMGGQTEQLADWNPFDQNASAPFFDADWMFNIKNGFDVVIGNPPYVQLQKLKEDASQLQKMRYKTFERTGDIYCLFYEKGIHLLKYKGVLSFITSSQWVKAAYGKSLRSYFLEFNPLFLLELGAGVFESATVDTNILFIEKAPNKKILKGIVVQKIEDVALSDYAAKMLAMPYVNKENWVVSDFAKQYITETIRKKGKPLKDWRVKIYFGVKTGFNDAFLIKEDTCNRLLEEDEKNIDLIRPILRGREIEKYYTSWEGDYVIATFPTFNLDIKAYPSIKQYLEGFLPKIYQTGEEFYNSEGVLEKTRKKTGNKWFETQDQIAFYEEFSKEKIIWKRIGSQLRFSYSDKEIYSLDSTCIATGEKIKYLTALLNSKVSHYQLFENSPKTGMGDLIISVQALEPLHVYYPKDEEQIIIEQILDFIIYQKRTPSVSAAIGQYLEQVIDGMVCELYFTEEMTSKGIDIIGIVSQDLAALPDFAPLSTEAKQAQIETLYRKWTAPASELNNRLSLMTIRSPDVLGVILGGK